ncbi:CAP domain-containing protein [Microtetraspora sp. NBRC 13810]|uniref:CAP domain-containing protein n=1 Tax=Microtetraspora sp. NBRC 13810 TaxID=3030990 RepID=UPI0025554351|nr:CAP domain-containing protein [Microtetraspora sp. NBRC 13810]
MAASLPAATPTSIRAEASRAGCTQAAALRIQLKWARSGADQVVKQARTIVRNGRFAAAAPCTTSPRTYYVVVTDGAGNTSRSKGVQLGCAPAATPAPTPTTAPTSTTPAPTPTAVPTSTAAPSTTAVPTSTPAPSTSPSGGTGTGTVGSTVEEEVVRLTNEARRTGGCAPLTHDAKLHTAARGHSSDMAAKGYFSHDSQDGRDPGDRIAAAGFSPIRAWGENIAMGQPTAAVVVKAWLDSPGHRANIMNCTYTHIGVGEAKGARGLYWTQDFGRH